MFADEITYFYIGIMNTELSFSINIDLKKKFTGEILFYWLSSHFLIWRYSDTFPSVHVLVHRKTRHLSLDNLFFSRSRLLSFFLSFFAKWIKGCLININVLRVIQRDEKPIGRRSLMKIINNYSKCGWLPFTWS